MNKVIKQEIDMLLSLDLAHIEDALRDSYKRDKIIFNQIVYNRTIQRQILKARQLRNAYSDLTEEEFMHFLGITEKQGLEGKDDINKQILEAIINYAPSVS